MTPTVRKYVPIMAVLLSMVVAASGLYVLYLEPKPPSDMLTGYGTVTDLTYQGTMISMVFTSNTVISLYSASISYTANNHAASEQSYQTEQMPLGSQSTYPLTKGGMLTISFSDIPAGSLLLNIDVEVNASIGAHYMLLSYDVAQLETNSTQ